MDHILNTIKYRIKWLTCELASGPSQGGRLIQVKIPRKEKLLQGGHGRFIEVARRLAQGRYFSDSNVL